jgi:hypothetical protein
LVHLFKNKVELNRTFSKPDYEIRKAQYRGISNLSKNSYPILVRFLAVVTRVGLGEGMNQQQSEFGIRPARVVPDLMASY